MVITMTDLEQAHALLSKIEKNPQARSPEAILLALIYEELKKLNKKTDRKEKQ
jgi:hypothetical protein